MGTRVGARAAGAGAGAGAAAVQGKKIFPMRAKDSGHPGKIAFSPGKFADLQVSQIRRRCRRAEEVVVEGLVMITTLSINLRGETYCGNN